MHLWESQVCLSVWLICHRPVSQAQGGRPSRGDPAGRRRARPASRGGPCDRMPPPACGRAGAGLPLPVSSVALCQQEAELSRRRRAGLRPEPKQETCRGFALTAAAVRARLQALLSCICQTCQHIRAAGVMCHQRAGWKQQTLLLAQLWRPEVRDQGVGRSCCPGRLRTRPSSPLPVLSDASRPGVPGFRLRLSELCPILAWPVPRGTPVTWH